MIVKRVDDQDAVGGELKHDGLGGSTVALYLEDQVWCRELLGDGPFYVPLPLDADRLREHGWVLLEE